MLYGPGASGSAGTDSTAAGDGVELLGRLAVRAAVLIQGCSELEVVLQLALRSDGVRCVFTNERSAGTASVAGRAADGLPLVAAVLALAAVRAVFAVFGGSVFGGLLAAPFPRSSSSLTMARA